jgi:hypothetical protein
LHVRAPHSSRRDRDQLGRRHVSAQVGNVGGQVDLRLVIFSALESTLSFGYAAAKEEGHQMDTEFMVSLKL